MITNSTIKEKDYRNICCFVSEFNKKAEQNGWVNLTPRETDSEYTEINGEINVYSQYLEALFFSVETIRVQNTLTFEIFEISTKDLLAIYTEGYKEGVKQFRDEYRLTMKDLTTIDTENHVEALKANYFHNGGWMGLNGWVFAKNTVFSSFTLERLKEYGKESGLLSEADKYIEQNPTIFKDFHTRNTKHSEQTQPPKLTAKHYALEYLFDCNIKGIFVPWGQKKELQRIGMQRMKGKKDGNTFYKACNDLRGTDINIENELIDVCGNNWKEAILYISETPKRLNEHLKTKDL